MSRFGLLTSLLAVLAVPACEPAEDAPSIEGATAQEATELVAATSCEFFSSCGVAVTTCSGTTAEDGSFDSDCETELVTIEYDECLTEGEQLLAEGFACVELDDATVALVDDCLAEFQSAECFDPEDEEAIEFGGMPEICAEALDVLLSCAEGSTTSPEG